MENKIEKNSFYGLDGNRQRQCPMCKGEGNVEFKPTGCDSVRPGSLNDNKTLCNKCNGRGVING